MKSLENNTCWVLTEEFNDYDQNGEYFVAVFGKKPTEEQLAPYVGHDTKHVLSGGGRQETEYHWYYLREEKLQ